MLRRVHDLNFVSLTVILIKIRSKEKKFKALKH